MNKEGKMQQEQKSIDQRRIQELPVKKIQPEPESIIFKNGAIYKLETSGDFTIENERVYRKALMEEIKELPQFSAEVKIEKKISKKFKYRKARKKTDTDSIREQIALMTFEVDSSGNHWYFNYLNAYDIVLEKGERQPQAEHVPYRWTVTSKKKFCILSKNFPFNKRYGIKWSCTDNITAASTRVYGGSFNAKYAAISYIFKCEKIRKNKFV